MGRRITQRVYECSHCGKIPDNGEYIWEMYNGNGVEYICENCVEDEEDEEDEGCAVG